MKTQCLIFILFIASCLFSTIINIPVDQPTIQAGIDVAVNADTVLVQPGTYFENINFNSKNITVASMSLTTQDTTYISQTVIDGNEIGSVVTIESGEDSTTVLIGFTITNGSRGVYCDSSDPLIQNVKIINNFGLNVMGVGILIENNSNIIMSDVVISNNFGSGDPWFGGGSAGGGICVINSTLKIFDSNIFGNTVIGFPSPNGPPPVPPGGGIFCVGSILEIENITIIGNVASQGGGISSHNSDLNLMNVTISDNSAFIFEQGGGINCCNNSNTNLLNCILWNNSPEEIYFYENSDPNSITISCSDIQGGETEIVTNNNGIVNWLEGNIDEDPLFVNQGEEDYHLQDTSPCIGAGIDEIEINGTWYFVPEFDIEGNPRPNPAGSMPDMGAFENEYGEPQVGIDENLIPLVSELNQNYPNPFNPSTTIEYSFVQDSFVQLSIYNIKGQKVRQLVSDQLPAGQHSVIWNGNNDNNKPVSSGVYFYKLKTDNSEKMKKMILIK